MTEAAVAYCNCMEDVKARLKLIKQITDGHSPLGSEGLDGEVVCLLLRKVLEQIAFSSLVAHRETYEAVHNDLDSVWRAKRLLERMDNLHPEFYPSPVRREESPYVGVHHHFVPLADGFLTKDDFVFLYDTASNGIHTWNPFKDAKRVLNFERPIAEWIHRIAMLLDSHLVRFVGTKDVWLIQMDNPEDHKVHAHIAPGCQNCPNRRRSRCSSVSNADSSESSVSTGSRDDSPPLPPDFRFDGYKCARPATRRLRYRRVLRR